MCETCLMDWCDNKPPVITEEMQELIDLCSEWYGMESNGTGGALHIVLDDMNVDDESIQWCIDNYEEYGVNSMTYKTIFHEITERLLAISIPERAVVTYNIMMAW